MSSTDTISFALNRQPNGGAYSAGKEVGKSGYFEAASIFFEVLWKDITLLDNKFSEIDIG
jgi:hypothetical protein